MRERRRKGFALSPELKPEILMDLYPVQNPHLLPLSPPSTSPRERIDLM